MIYAAKNLERSRLRPMAEESKRLGNQIILPVAAGLLAGCLFGGLAMAITSSAGGILSAVSSDQNGPVTTLSYAVTATAVLVIAVLSGLVVFFARASRLEASRPKDTPVVEREIDFSVYDDVETIGHWSRTRAADTMFWSPSMYKIFGRDPDTFVPRQSAVMSCYAPEYRKSIQDKGEDAVRTGAGFEVEAQQMPPFGIGTWRTMF